MYWSFGLEISRNSANSLAGSNAYSTIDFTLCANSVVSNPYNFVVQISSYARTHNRQICGRAVATINAVNYSVLGYICGVYMANVERESINFKLPKCHCKDKLSNLLTLWFQRDLLNLCLQSQCFQSLNR